MGAEDQLKKLRFLIKGRLDAGEFTQSELADRVNLTGATISNFVNGLHGARPATIDLYKNALGISDQDLQELSTLSVHPEIEMVPLVRQATAINAALITRDLILRKSDLSVAALRHYRSKPTMDREHWTRFVAVVMTRSQVRFLDPKFTDGTTLFIDRHDQRLDLKIKGAGEIYAVNREGFLGIGYLEPMRDSLLLRPYLPTIPCVQIDVRGNRSASYFIIGRICLAVTPLTRQKTNER
jgi:transcriptional regulator with XRE-family HTH domain